MAKVPGASKMFSVRPILLLYVGCSLSFPLTSINKRDVPDFVRQYGMSYSSAYNAQY